MARALALRLLLAGLLLGAYFYVWRPYDRTATVRSVAVPLCRAVGAASAVAWTVRARPGGRRLLVRSSSGNRSIAQSAPAGVRFLLPALGLVLVAPRRLYWLGLWGGRLALGMLGLALLCLGMVAGSGWFMLYDALTQYLVGAFSLGVATWAVLVEFGLRPFAPSDAG